jgi:predicted MPP superfamily phosphohydrolase
MPASLVVLLASAAPALTRGISLRPRLGLFPIVLGMLCLLWVGLMRYALPGFGRRLTRIALAVTALVVLSLLPRFLWRGAFTPPWFYGWVVLPSTVVQVAMLAGLMSAPLWVLLGRLAKGRLRTLPASLPAPQVVTAPPEPVVEEPERALGRPLPRALAALRRRLLLPAEPGAARSPLLSRRALLAGAPWVIPGGAMIVSAYGSLIESRQVVVRRLRVAIPGLHPSLHGLRIGQVTDIHIARLQTQFAHLERGLALLADEHPDLVCPTGDLCDEPRLHRDVLRLIKQVPARLGHFACLGNHELYLGLPDWLRRGYDSAQIQLLEDESVVLGKLRLAGISYPHSGGNPRMDPDIVPGLLDETLRDRETLRERQADETTVLLSHHPHVFQHVGGRGVALQLSGHTHGGQLGRGEGSWMEPLYPLARGRYRSPDGATELFVSAGLGHWLPFRVNCPPEVVLITLVPA